MINPIYEKLIPTSPIHEVFPYLIVRGAPAAIDFYTRVFGVKETFRLAEPGGRIGHAQLQFGPGKAAS